jgi:hypothetical protein
VSLWKFVLCTDEFISPPVTNIGELIHATDRRLSSRLNRASTLGFKVRMDDPLADTLLEGHCLVKAYRGGVLRFIGDVVTADEVWSDIASDIVVQELRWQILQEHVRVRKNPRQVIQFTPIRSDLAGTITHSIPSFGFDYDIGDIVTFRAAVRGEARVDAKFRVYGADVSIEPEGEERVTLSVIPSE